jgi:hypothetical protein
MQQGSNCQQVSLVAGNITITPIDTACLKPAGG